MGHGSGLFHQTEGSGLLQSCEEESPRGRGEAAAPSARKTGRAWVVWGREESPQKEAAAHLPPRHTFSVSVKPCGPVGHRLGPYSVQTVTEGTGK